MPSETTQEQRNEIKRQIVEHVGASFVGTGIHKLTEDDLRELFSIVYDVCRYTEQKWLRTRWIQGESSRKRELASR